MLIILSLLQLYSNFLVMSKVMYFWGVFGGFFSFCGPMQYYYLG